MNTLMTPAPMTGSGPNTHVQTMSSREIAELTGKAHAHVMRDIRAMLEQVGEGQSKFGSTYEDAQGKARECYNLPRDLTYTLITGYRADLRHKIITRWMELETAIRQPAVPAIPQTYAAALLEAGRLALENEALTVASQKQQAEITRLTPKAYICEEAIRPEGGHDLRTFLTSIGPVNVPETFRWLERRKMIHRPTSKLDTGWLVTRNGMTEGRRA